MGFLSVVMIAFSTIMIMVGIISPSTHHLTYPVVIWAAERHDCGRSALNGNCQHQQPHQKRSDEHTHVAILPQRTCRVIDNKNTCARIGNG